jgi:hypothetical protein
MWSSSLTSPFPFVPAHSDFCRGSSASVHSLHVPWFLRSHATPPLNDPIHLWLRFLSEMTLTCSGSSVLISMLLVQIHLLQQVSTGMSRWQLNLHLNLDLFPLAWTMLSLGWTMVSGKGRRSGDRSGADAHLTCIQAALTRVTTEPSNPQVPVKWRQNSASWVGLNETIMTIAYICRAL